MTRAVPIPLSICVCTFRRPRGLQRLLAALVEQRFDRVASPELSVIVADNEPSERARNRVADFAAKSPFPVQYVPEPRRGISHARNACLDAVAIDATFLAFIDDDEVPDTDWLDALLWAQAQSGAEVVQGSVWPEFADGHVPRWIREGDYFGRYTKAPEGDRTGGSDPFPELEQAVTSNVLVRRDAVVAAGARFEPRFALTGAEDTEFFKALRAAGSRIVLARQARVREIVPPERATLGYLVRLKVRDGQNRELTRPATGKAPGGLRRFKRVWRSSGGHAMSEGLAQVGAQFARGRWRQADLAEGLLRTAYGFGQLRGTVGWRYEHYRRADASGRRAEPRQG